jgi:uncharacterized membrane protein
MASLSQSLADNPALESMTSRAQENVAPVERIASAAMGAAAIGYGLSRWSVGGLLLAAIGGALVHRGMSGHCYAYDALGINTRERNTCAGVRGADGIKVTQSLTIGRSPAEVYQFWRRLENLPRFMKHVKTVESIDEVQSRWVVKGPAGSQVEWTAKILADRENEVISWESLPGAEVQECRVGVVRTGGERRNRSESDSAILSTDRTAWSGSRGVVRRSSRPTACGGSAAPERDAGNRICCGNN